MTDEIKKPKGSFVHRQVERVLRKVGEDLSHARRGRRIGTEDFADRMGISRATLHRLEKGDPGISLNTLAMALHTLGRLNALRDIMDPAGDDVLIMQMKEQAPKRIGKRRSLPPAPEAAGAPNEGGEPEKPTSKYVGF